MATYLPGGTTYEGGLFAWERALLEDARIPRSGRVLLAAAGGGRELRALCQAGYEVTAFEPNPDLLSGARATGQAFPRARVLEGSYADLVNAVEAGTGPLAELSVRSFDWMLLGWGSFTHVTEPREQALVLRAARALVPSGPVVLSFFLKNAAADVPSRSRVLRRALRSAFGRLGGAATPPPGLSYEYGGGFAYHFTEAELRGLAESAGYAVTRFDVAAFPHAILLPR
jgi:hypothetical protein